MSRESRVTDRIRLLILSAAKDLIGVFRTIA
jgi:hypothetical protein